MTRAMHHDRHHVCAIYEMHMTRHDMYAACMRWHLCDMYDVVCDVAYYVWHVTCMLHLWHMMGHACDICYMWLTCDTTYTTWDDMTCMRGDMQHVTHVTTCITWNSYDNMRCGDATHVRWWHNTLRHDNMHDMKCNMQHETWWHATHVRHGTQHVTDDMHVMCHVTRLMWHQMWCMSETTCGMLQLCYTCHTWHVSLMTSICI